MLQHQRCFANFASLRETSLVVTIAQIKNDDEISEARLLFREYEAWLGLDLCFQGFEQELRDLPGKYVPPEGRLLLAKLGNEVAGCIAMRKLGKGICEMKRLFVRDTFRGHGIGEKLIHTLIEEARAENYRAMRLDTFPPKMGKAVSLYTSHGFYPIDSYYENPHEDVLFMELDLT